MELLTNEQKARIPALYSQENEADPLCGIKFFTPDAQWTWYAIEGGTIDDHPDDFMFFGYVSGLECELGYFTLAQLREVRGALGLPVERDLYFQPAPLSTIKAKHE